MEFSEAKMEMCRRKSLVLSLDTFGTRISLLERAKREEITNVECIAYENYNFSYETGKKKLGTNRDSWLRSSCN